MKKAAAGPLAAVLLAGFFQGGGTASIPFPVPDSDPAALIPAAGEVPGWTPRGEAQRFDGEDLYVYIDGGAEIFNEYGFRRVIAQDFENPGGAGIALEIYEMTDPAAAFGIYSFQRSGQGQAAGLGTEGEIEDYYLRFWKGPYLAVVTGYDPHGRDPGRLMEGVIAVARAVDARIRESGGRPAFVEALPPDWMEPGLKYLRGVLGLNNLVRLFPRDVLRFREAAAVPIEGGWLFVCGYQDAAEAESRLAGVREAMSAREGGYGEFQAFPDGRLEAADSRGNRIVVRAAGDKIGLVVSPRAAAVAEALLERLR